MTSTPIFNTERIKLHPFTQNDIELFLSLNQDAFIRKFMWDDELIDENTAIEILQKNDSHLKHDRYGIWKIMQSGSDEVIGYVGLWYFFSEPQPQLIYALLEKYTGLGYATEAGSIIINYAFNDLHFDYVIAATDEPHQASQSVAKRLNMKFVEKRMENGKPTLFYKIKKSE